MSIRTDIVKFAKGFGYAFKGLVYCVKTQRNFRFHLGIAPAVMWGAAICQVKPDTVLALMICIGVVLSLEAVNTAIESAVDLVCGDERKPLAAHAKDCAAGAVLIFSAVSAVIGCLVFFNDQAVGKIVLYFGSKPIMLLAAAVYVILFFIWVFVCFGKNK